MVNHIIICSHSFVYFPFFPLFPLNSLLFQMPPFDLHPIWFFYSEYATFCDSALFEFCACFALCVCTMYIYIVRCLHGDFKTEQLNINASFLSQHNRNALLNTHSRNIFTVVWKRKMNGVHVICYFCFKRSSMYCREKGVVSNRWFAVTFVTYKRFFSTLSPRYYCWCLAH